MTKTDLSNPYIDTCAFCLGAFHLSGEKDIPIRHGFNAYNIRHGQNGGYHSGPCSGVNYPRLGVSTEGTKVALAGFQAQLKLVEERLAWLATNPDLTWSYQETERTSRTGTGRRPVGEKFERTLKPGTQQERIEYKSRHGYTSSMYVPSYEQEHKSQTSTWELHKRSLNDLISKFQGVIDNWQPRDKVYDPVKPVIHLQADLAKGARPSCNRVMQGFKAAALAARGLMTTDKSKVTCQRCKAH